MDNENIKAVVDNALVDNASEMREALYNAINDKIFAAIEQRKIAVAANMLAMHGQNNEAATETE
jgi:hypothetical protein